MAPQPQDRVASKVAAMFKELAQVLAQSPAAKAAFGHIAPETQNLLADLFKKHVMDRALANCPDKVQTVIRQRIRNERSDDFDALANVVTLYGGGSVDAV